MIKSLGRSPENELIDKVFYIKGSRLLSVCLTGMPQASYLLLGVSHGMLSLFCSAGP